MSLFSTARFIFRHPLNRSGRLAGLGRFVRWQVVSRLLPYPVAIPFVDDYKLFVERGMTGATGNYYCGLHEASDMAFVLHFMRPGDVFYDIGANVGSYTLLAAATGVSRVHAFEPAVATSERLKRNVVLNGIEPLVALHCCALGKQDGEVQFTTTHDTINHVIATDEVGEPAATVPIRRFDDFHEAGRPSFIKMDVEGYEAHVLAGATSALADLSLMGMLVEDNGSDLRYGRQGNVAEMLAGYGFSPFRYDPLIRELLSHDGRAPEFGNVLFLRDAALARDRVTTARRFRLINGSI